MDIIEAAYRLETGVEEWMRDVGELIAAHMGHGLGAIALRYEIGGGNDFRPLAVVPINIDPAAVATIVSVVANTPSWYIAQTFGSVPCNTASATGGRALRRVTGRIYRDHFASYGWHDAMIVNGLDPTRRGFCLAAWLPRTQPMTAQLRVRWSRIAAHLAAANRLSWRLAATRPEAVLTPAGRVEHAEQDAKAKQVLSDLTSGAQAIGRARGKLRRKEPDLAVAEWKGLIAARWTLIDHFESDGKQYLLARKNPAVPPGISALSEREGQAVGFAALGHPNKLIAYEMGIAASTVSVLLLRAARKVGARTRAGLIAAWLKRPPFEVSDP